MEEIGTSQWNGPHDNKSDDSLTTYLIVGKIAPKKNTATPNAAGIHKVHQLECACSSALATIATINVTSSALVESPRVKLRGEYFCLCSTEFLAGKTLLTGVSVSLRDSWLYIDRF
jgi:hypothetical protein